MKKLFFVIVFAPIALALIVLSVANRHMVLFNFDPINREQPFLSFEMPFFIFLFVALIVGMLIGSTMTWFTQAKFRKMARLSKREANKWEREALEQKERAIQAQSANASGASDNPQSSGTLSLSGRAA